jgi:hypothetical protein
MPTVTFAWCFSHGRLHKFAPDVEPWCTGNWVAFVARSEEEAMEAKVASYGEAVSFDDLPYDKKLEVLDIRNTWG